MTRIERRLLVQNVLIGAALSVVVAVANYYDALAPLELAMRDFRTYWYQRYIPPPTDRLVHLDIDDSSLDAMGAWPWPRTTLGLIVDELRLAGARAVAFDVVFPEPQKPRFEVAADGQSVTRIEDDQNLAVSISTAGNVLLATAVSVRHTPSPAGRLAVQTFRGNPALPLADAEKMLLDQGLKPGDLPAGVDLDTVLVIARRQVILEGVEGQLRQGRRDFAAVRQWLMPEVDPMVLSGSPLLNIARRQYDQGLALEAIRRYAAPKPVDATPALAVQADLPPIPVLAQAAAGNGFVTYLADRDGVVRSVPLLADDGKALLPQLGLALSCAYLGIHPREVRIEDDWLILPRTARPGGGELAIPVRQLYSRKAGGRVDYMFDVPWFGDKEHWETMYDPDHRRVRQHLPLHMVWQVQQKLSEIRNNNAQIDKAISVVLDDDAPNKLALDPQRGKAYRQQQLDALDTEARVEMVQWTRKTLTDSGWLEAFQAMDPATLSAEEKFQRDQLLLAVKALDEGVKWNRQWAMEAAEARTGLRREMEGKAVLLGWTGTATVADFVPTSLHTKCPGVVVHGAVFNAIMTGHMWKVAPPWVAVAITIILGLAATAFVARFTPVWALLSCAMLALAYLQTNGALLFDYMDLLVDAAGPTVAITLIWSAGTVSRFITERTERARITRRFRSYVDPALVNYVIEHPETARLDGEQKELSVVFTDLAGFTTLSERLRERTVPILNEYMGIMVPLIRSQRGYVNKFLGDGIMFFFGAPRADDCHAVSAVRAALAMQSAMVPFNDSLAERDLPQVKMRVGISTGPMVVGDAGSVDASDYTVLGDAVNLGARLESANKHLGTWVLLNERNAELAGSAYLLRPVANLQVVGKSEGVMTFEPLAPAGEASEEQRMQADLCAAVVKAYSEADFARCVKQLDELESAGGPAKYVALYRHHCRRWMAAGDEKFDGLIVLEEK